MTGKGRIVDGVRGETDMQKQYRCANGHHWEAGGSGLALAAIACPSCGATAETAVVSGPADRLGTTAPAPNMRRVTSSTPLPGAFGRYEIEQIIGKGGMGSVYKAFDRELHRLVALKIPHVQPDDPESLQRFKQEAQAAATFNHPNLC